MAGMAGIASVSNEARTIWGHLIVLVVLAGGFYALVLYPLVLDDLTKGAIIGFMGAAIQWEFNNQVASSTAKQQQAVIANGTLPHPPRASDQPPVDAPV